MGGWKRKRARPPHPPPSLPPKKERDMDSWISGDDSCKAFADGTKMTPSYVCYFFVFVLIVGVVTNLTHVASYPAYSLSHAALGSGLVYLLYENCRKCNGGRGWLLAVAVGCVVGIVLNALPMRKPVVEWKESTPPPTPRGNLSHGPSPFPPSLPRRPSPPSDEPPFSEGEKEHKGQRPLSTPLE